VFGILIGLDIERFFPQNWDALWSVAKNEQFSLNIFVALGVVFCVWFGSHLLAAAEFALRFP